MSRAQTVSHGGNLLQSPESYGDARKPKISFARWRVSPGAGKESEWRERTRRAVQQQAVCPGDMARATARVVISQEWQNGERQSKPEEWCESMRPGPDGVRRNQSAI